MWNLKLRTVGHPSLEHAHSLGSQRHNALSSLPLHHIFCAMSLAVKPSGHPMLNIRLYQAEGQVGKFRWKLSVRLEATPTTRTPGQLPNMGSMRFVGFPTHCPYSPSSFLITVLQVTTWVEALCMTRGHVSQRRLAPKLWQRILAQP